MKVTAVSAQRTSTDVDNDTAGTLITAFAATPDSDPSQPALRGRTIEAWLPLAQHLARRYSGRGEPDDDLVQVAMVGLIKAVDRYDLDHGVAFVAFAIPTIVGELKRHFRDRAWAIRVPRRLQELRLDISAANNVLAPALARPPTVADIAAYLKISAEDVLEGLEAARAYRTTSLSTPVNDDSGREIADTLGSEDHGFELAELHIALGPAMATLNEREQRILSLRFYGNRSQSEIGEQVGISQMHVSRLLSRALGKLRLQLVDGAPAVHGNPVRCRRLPCSR
jgi:RNA polymerase sigma-B factor